MSPQWTTFKDSTTYFGTTYVPKQISDYISYGTNSNAFFGAGKLFSDSNYYYVSYSYPGTYLSDFTALKSIVADILVVGGGGGGPQVNSVQAGGTLYSAPANGGGGAGEARLFQNQILNGQYPIIVGSGGTLSDGVTLPTVGGYSQFGNLGLVTGGGSGGTPTANASATIFNAAGGGGGTGTGFTTAGSGAASFYSAGAGRSTTTAAGGGGAGLGGNGTAAANGVGGGGGIGISTYSSWLQAIFYNNDPTNAPYYICSGGAGTILLSGASAAAYTASFTAHQANYATSYPSNTSSSPIPIGSGATAAVVNKFSNPTAGGGLVVIRIAKSQIIP